MLGGSYMVYRYNSLKDISSLPEINSNNEEIIFSNYKIVAFDEGHVNLEPKTGAFITALKSNKAFYILLHSKYQPKVGLSGRMKSNTCNIR